MKIIVNQKNKIMIILVSDVENMDILQVIVGPINLHFQNHHLQKNVIYVENMDTMK